MSVEKFRYRSQSAYEILDFLQIKEATPHIGTNTL